MKNISPKYDNILNKVLLSVLIITGKRWWIQSLDYEIFDLGEIFKDPPFLTDRIFSVAKSALMKILTRYQNGSHKRLFEQTLDIMR